MTAATAPRRRWLAVEWVPQLGLCFSVGIDTFTERFGVGVQIGPLVVTLWGYA